MMDPREVEPLVGQAVLLVKGFDVFVHPLEAGDE
jgi:hypothetical protein